MKSPTSCMRILVVLGATLVTMAAGVPALAAQQGSGHAGGYAATPHRAALPVVLRTDAPTPLPTIGRPQPIKSPDIEVTLNSLHRDSSGLVTLTWSVRNTGSDPFYPNEVFTSDSYKYASPYISAITLTDESAKLRYNPLQTIPSEYCACTNTATVPSPVERDTPLTLYNMYKLPTNVSSVTVEIPHWTAVKNVAVN